MPLTNGLRDSALQSDIFSMITKSCAYYVSVFVVLVSSPGLSSLIPKHGHLTVRACRYFGWFNAKTTGLKQDAILAPIDGICATKGVTCN